ncbi:MAG: hypothetical protein EBZ48_06075, partial [Proteobacteria bacterium]|nr:hypothetical protein [Pseudomonadota bacterium]
MGLCAAVSLASLRTAFLAAEAENATEDALRGLPRGANGTILRFGTSADTALRASLRSAEVKKDATETIRAAGWLSERGRMFADYKDRIPLICQALALYGEALQRYPRDSRLFLGAAAQRQLLGNYRCNSPNTEMTVSNLLAQALYWEPWDADVLFWGAR